MKRIKGRSLIAGLFVAICASKAIAIPLLPDNSILLNGTIAAINPELSGSVINDNIAGYLHLQPDSPHFTFGYEYQNRVVRSDETGNVIIAPRLRNPFNVTSGLGLIDSFSINGYAGWDVDVNYRTDGEGDRGPTSVDRSADGDVLTFTFGFPLVIGNLLGMVQEESFFINILTDAPEFTTTGTATLFGRNLFYPDELFSASIGGIAVPASARVPEPSIILLLLAGFSGLFLRRAKTTSLSENEITPTT